VPAACTTHLSAVAQETSPIEAPLPRGVGTDSSRQRAPPSVVTASVMPPAAPAHISAVGQDGGPAFCPARLWFPGSAASDRQVAPPSDVR
jgi:hypothetical protein